MVKPILSRNEVLELMKTGLNQNEVAKKLGVSRQLISQKLSTPRKGGKIQQEIKDMKVGEIRNVSGSRSIPYHIAAKTLGMVVTYRKGKLIRME